MKSMSNIRMARSQLEFLVESFDESQASKKRLILFRLNTWLNECKFIVRRLEDVLDDVIRED